ncbi:MAG: hypothetical protein H6706_20225 [Myxococcales bacterium]|nr:hypothetical protein [Myxococcales bacterium]
MIATAAALAALLSPIADVELGLGAAVCGARGRADCAGAGTGLTVDLQADWRPWPWLGLGVEGLYSSLPAEGVEAGTLFFVGPAVTGRAEVAPGLTLLAGVAVGYNRIAGTRGQASALGALGLRAGGRYRLGPTDVGLDYGLLRPTLDDACAPGGACAPLDVALVHRFSVVAGLPF